MHAATPNRSTDTSKPPRASTIVLVGVDEDLPALLADGEMASSALDAVQIPPKLDEAHAALNERDVAVLCLGAGVAGAEARDFLLEVAERHPGYHGHNVVLAAGPRLEIFQDLVDTDQIYYLTQTPPPPRDVAGILRSAARDRPLPARVDSEQESEDDERHALFTHQALALTDVVAAESTPEGAANRAADAVLELVDADRAEVLLYDPTTETLWSKPPGADEERRESAAAGLVSFVVRTRSAVRLERVGEDPRYDAEADNAEGPSGERFLAAPVVSATEREGATRPWAVAVALRGEEAPVFTEDDELRLVLFAEHLAPLLSRQMQRAELEKRTLQRHGVGGSEAAGIFRDEALEHHVQGFEDQGHLIEISPRWTVWAYRVLLAMCAAAFLFSFIAPIHEYAAGPAVVRVLGRTDVPTPVSGTVAEVSAASGQRVAEGDILVRLDDDGLRDDLEQARRDYEDVLFERLLRPAADVPSGNLPNLRNRLERARRALEERTVRATHEGIVRDVWAEPEQHLVAGQVLLSLEREASELGVVALIPGQYRPQLETGMSLRLEVSGFQYAYQSLTVERVGDAVMGPAEAIRVLGPMIGDAILPLLGGGPVVLVEARLPERTFESGGEVYLFHDGNLATAEIQVRSEPILLTLVPGLKAIPGFEALFGRSDA